jgi:hypothetical protein
MQDSGEIYYPAALPSLLPGKRSLYPLNRSFHGPQSMSGLFGEEKIFFLQWESKRDSSVFHFFA